MRLLRKIFNKKHNLSNEVLHTVIRSNLKLLWWGWSTVWGVIGICFAIMRIFNYYA